jgi:phosphatidylserine/phosphatidylglycerophosphate/cardiolipin synthase-like enzyme
MASTTNPSDWFLPVLAFTNGNTATPLIDGDSYYRDLVNIFTSNAGFSNILISGWRLKKETVVDNASGLTFEALLTSRVQSAGAFPRVKSMLWYVPGTIGDFGASHGPENSDFTEFVLAQGGRAILDNRLPAGRFASHHQKYIVVDGTSTRAAYIGGIDIAPDRMDSNAHDSSIPRMEESVKAWHDVQLKIEGPAVADAMRAFQERWNDERKPHTFPAAGGTVPPRLTDAEIPQCPATGGTHSIQLLSTYACRSGEENGNPSSFPFAPNGRHDYQDALVYAIRNAEHYIYVEDQYCWPSDVVTALGDAANRGVAVILVLASQFDPAGLKPYHNFLRSRAIESLLSRDSAQNRVFVFHLERSTIDPATHLNEQIFVHSKSMIIDDRYLVIGSGNLNRRSMTTDSELGAAVVDTDAVSSTIRGQPRQVARLALRYRKALWSEHLNSPATDDPFDAAGFPAGFPKDDSLVGHVRRHKVPEPRFCNPPIVPYGFLNANVTCTKEGV